ncbi:MAG: gamma-glutamyl-gamma-aminobutyrate hydrolase family protein [Candidatus Bathyarchaeia archaeon]
MTKTLLINCYLKTAEIAGLQRVLEKHNQVTVVPYGEVGCGYQVDFDIDAIVISGSEARIVKAEDKARYKGVSELIKDCKLPILGICFGHQLLCATFGAKTGSLSKPVIDKFEQVRLIQPCELFNGFTEGQAVTLAQYHNDYVQKDGLEEAGFMLLADSESCEVEAVKHKTKPFYGCQFHPERIKIKNKTHSEGHAVIENFYNKALR